MATEPDVALVAITASLMSFVFISSERVNAPDAAHHLEDAAVHWDSGGLADCDHGNVSVPVLSNSRIRSSSNIVSIVAGRAVHLLILHGGVYGCTELGVQFSLYGHCVSVSSYNRSVCVGVVPRCSISSNGKHALRWRWIVYVPSCESCIIG